MVGRTLRDWLDRKVTRMAGSWSSHYERLFRASEWMYSGVRVEWQTRWDEKSKRLSLIRKKGQATFLCLDSYNVRCSLMHALCSVCMSAATLTISSVLDRLSSISAACRRW